MRIFQSLTAKLITAGVIGLSLVVGITAYFLTQSSGAQQPPTVGILPLLDVSAVGPPLSATDLQQVPDASLLVHVSYLPPDSPGNIVVSGPDGYRRSLTETTTLTDLEPGAYTVSTRIVNVDGVRTAPVKESQEVEVTAGAPAFVAVEYANRIATNYVEVPIEVLSEARFSESGGVTSVTLSNDQLQPGDLFAFAPSPVAPDGVAGFVTGRTVNANGSVTYETSQATLQDLVPQGKIRLTAGDVAFEDADSEFVVRTGAITGAATSTSRLPLSSALANLWKSCGRDVEMGPTEPSSPLVSINPVVTLDWFDSGQLAKMDAVVEVSVETSIGIEAVATVTCDTDEQLLARKNLPPRTLRIGPVPVVILPVAELTGRATLTSRGSISALVSAQAGAVTGVDAEANSWALPTAAAAALTPALMPVVPALIERSVDFAAYQEDPLWTETEVSVAAASATDSSTALTGKMTFLIYGLTGPYGSATAKPSLKVASAGTAEFNDGSAAPMTNESLTTTVQADLLLTAGINTSMCDYLSQASALPQSVCENLDRLSHTWTPISEVLYEAPSQSIGNVPDPCAGTPRCVEQSPIYFSNDLKQDRIGFVPSDSVRCSDIGPAENAPSECAVTLRVGSGLFESVQELVIPQFTSPIEYLDPIEVFNTGSRRKQIVLLTDGFARGRYVQVIDFVNGEFRSVSPPSPDGSVYGPPPSTADDLSVWGNWGGATYGTYFVGDRVGSGTIVSCDYFTVEPQGFTEYETLSERYTTADGRWVQLQSTENTYDEFSRPFQCTAGFFPEISDLVINMLGCEDKPGCSVSVANYQLVDGEFRSSLYGRQETTGDPLTFTVERANTEGISIAVSGGKLLDSRANEPGGSAYAAAIGNDGGYCWAGTTDNEASIAIDASIEAPNTGREGSVGLIPYGQDVPLCQGDLSVYLGNPN